MFCYIAKEILADVSLLSRSLSFHQKRTYPGEPYLNVSLLKAERKSNSQTQGRLSVPQTLEAMWEAVCVGNEKAVTTFSTHSPLPRSITSGYGELCPVNRNCISQDPWQAGTVMQMSSSR